MLLEKLSSTSFVTCVVGILLYGAIEDSRCARQVPGTVIAKVAQSEKGTATNKYQVEVKYSDGTAETLDVSLAVYAELGIGYPLDRDTNEQMPIWLFPILVTLIGLASTVFLSGAIIDFLILDEPFK